MKLDKQTVEILSNFSKINPGLFVPMGNTVMTVHHQAATPIAKAEFANVVFPADFAIYDLSRLLSILGLFVDPEIEFEDNALNITDAGNRKGTFRYADKRILRLPAYDKNPNVPFDLEFKLTEANVKYVLKAVGAFIAPEIAVIGDGKTVRISTYDSKNPNVDKFSVEVGETDKSFTIVLNTSQFTFLNRDYDVSISFKGLVQFRSENDHDTVTYWIAASEKSKIDN